MEFAYITFCNNNPAYLNLLKYTILSVIEFSKHSFIIYLISVDKNSEAYKEVEKLLSDRIKFIHIPDMNLPMIYYYKPYIIMQSIQSGLKSGYYIECDDLLTPNADRFLPEKAATLSKVPISPGFQEETYFNIPNLQFPKKTQRFIHAHVLFKHTNLEFIQNWVSLCMMIKDVDDEKLLNICYWAFNCQQHYLPVIDPWSEHFYNIPEYRRFATTFHGQKDIAFVAKLLDDMKAWYRKRVVSFSLDHNNIIALQETISSYKKFLPDFTLRFYVCKSRVHKETLNLLETFKVEVVLKSDDRVKFWKYQAHDDYNHTVILYRNVEPITEAEVKQIQTWLQSDKTFYIHRNVNNKTKLPDSMWGSRRIMNFNMCLEVQNYLESNSSQNVDEFLANKIYHFTIANSIVFDDVSDYETQFDKFKPISV